MAGSTLPDGASADRLARSARELWEAADGARRELGRDELAQLEVATPDGSVFLVRDAARMIIATTSADPTVGLVFYDLKACLRSIAESAHDGGAAEPAVEPEQPAPPAAEAGGPRSRSRRASPRRRPTVARRRVWTALAVAVASATGSVLLRRRRTRNQSRVDLYFDDGSMLSLGDSTPEAERLLPLAHEVLAVAGPGSR